MSSDLQKIAYALWCATNNEPEVSQIAIAWALRNKSRVLYGINCQPKLSLCHETLCDELDAPKPCQKQLSAPQIWCVLANLCRVWAGQIEDPTEGAIAFHLHNVTPSWAVGLQPVALIGRRFFYNSPTLNA